MKFSIIIPIFNEKNNISLLASKINSYLKKYKYEIIFVDDSSTDGSKNILLKLNKKYKNLRVIFRKDKIRDLAKSCGDGFEISKFESKDQFEEAILNELKDRNIKLICLAGYMKILSKNFIKYFKNKIINIHPSLLPKFKGLNTHKRVLKSGAKYSGCTVHFVSPELDSGKIILQKRVLISKNETEDSLRKKILIQEHKIYSQSIISIFK